MSLCNVRKLILKCRYSLGDIVMLTAAVRDLHATYPGQFQTDVRTYYEELWLGNPHLTPLNEWDEGVATLDCDYPLVQRANEAAYHCLHGFLEFLNEQLKLHIRPGAMKGDLYLLEKERALPSPIRSALKCDLPYWIIDAGGKYDYTIKWWSTRRYQEVVDALSGKVLFVQVGGKKDYHPLLQGVIDQRGKTSVRELIHWVHHAKGVICPVTSLMHLAAAVETRHPQGGMRPCVVVAGGREPPHWEAYPGHQFIHNVGALECCSTGGCWKSRTFALGDGHILDHPSSRCVDVVEQLPRCMSMITSEDVIRRVQLYLEGKVCCALTLEEATAAGAAIEQPSSEDDESLSVESAPELLSRFLGKLPSQRSDRSGRGVVMCAGGLSYLTNAWVCIRRLRASGCSLPIELWHLGPHEMPEHWEYRLAPYGVVCRDARMEHPVISMKQMGGWELKPFAIAHSSFREVLFLDADNVPLIDPARLFEETAYRENGAIFWPDRGRMGPDRSIWRLCGVRYQDEPEFESGQMVIDTDRCWPALCVTLWLNRHSDFFYQHIHGDKETFHMAWRKLDQPYGMPRTPLQVIDQVFCQHDFSGARMFQHYTGRKWSLLTNHSLSRELLLELECREDLEALRSSLQSSIHAKAESCFEIIV